MARFAFLAPLTLCILTACGGGSGGSDTPPPPPPAKIDPEGLWHGTAKSSSNELVADVMADGLGSAYAMLNAADGTPSEALYMSGFSPENFTPGSLAISRDGYYRHVAGGFYSTVGSAAVTVQSGSTQKTLQFQVDPGLSGGNPRAVVLNYDPQYDKAVTVASLVGSYSSKTAGNTMNSLTISNVDPNSMLISSNPACLFSNSRMTALSGSKNLFSVVGILSGSACPMEGIVTGTAYAELASDGQVIGINIALRSGSGTGFYVFQGKKN